MIFAEIITERRPVAFWRMLRQVGVDHVISVLPRWFSSSDWRAVPEDDPWDYVPLLRLKNMVEDNGLRLVGIEDNPPMDGIRYGIRERKEVELDYVGRMIENMGKLGMKVWVYNWMAGTQWGRTHTHMRGPAGEYVTAFRLSELAGAPPPKMGRVDAATLWRNLKDFLDYVVPLAEQYDVRLAMHPDDPPIPEYRGVARIMSSVESFERLFELNKSEYNGMVFCQGNFSLMTSDMPSVIRKFKDRIYFVHFREVVGSREDFREVMVGTGGSDLVGVMRAYVEIGYRWYVRVDHTPTLEGDEEFIPGYSYLGRLYSIGYVKGLYDAVARTYGGSQPGHGA